MSTPPTLFQSMVLLYIDTWDIKCNALNCQLITFGGCNPDQYVITISGNSIPWVLGTKGKISKRVFSL